MAKILKIIQCLFSIICFSLIRYNSPVMLTRYEMHHSLTAKAEQSNCYRKDSDPLSILFISYLH